MLVLASSSPYRKALLEKIKLEFSVCVADIDESVLAGESAVALVERLSLQKAQAVLEQRKREGHTEDVIIASDQVCECDGVILTKPHTRENAIKQLQSMSGKAVHFYTGICVLGQDTVVQHDVFTVELRTLTLAQIERYIELDHPLNCAGSFKSEGLGISLFTKMSGDDPNALVGLPLIKLVDMLEHEGISVL